MDLGFGPHQSGLRVPEIPSDILAQGAQEAGNGNGQDLLVELLCGLC